MMLLLVLLLLLTSAPVFADDPVALPPIVVEGSSADALLYDPIAPSADSAVDRQTSNGSLERQISEDLPVPVTDYGTPGTTTQVRGLGRSAEDTNVQTLGVPLNQAQGGGFDLSSFPQFFWSRYQFHLGPSTGGYDPRGQSATLTLTPWTAEALRSARNRFRLTQSVTRGLSQTSVAAKVDRVAALVGVSAVNAKGPTGSLSAQLLRKGNLEVRAHFLGTSVDETSPRQNGSTPRARYKNTRWIPIVEVNGTPSSELLVKQTLFYDRSSIRFVNPENPSGDSYDRSSQLGSESAVLWKDYTFGASVRRTTFEQIGFHVPDEWLTHLQGGRMLRAGTWTFDGSAQADAVSRIGWRPGASLGARSDWNDQLGTFLRANYSYRFPTPVDRYYMLFGIVPNPELKAERAFSLNPGVEWRGGAVTATLQAYLQFRSNAILFNSQASQTQNQGDAQMYSLLHDLTFHVNRTFDLTNSLRFAYSHVEQTGTRVPYDPLAIETIQARVHEAKENPVWNAGLAARAQSRSPVGRDAVTGGPVENAGYAWVDLDAGYRLGEEVLGIGELLVQGRIDNLMDRPIEVIQGFPWPGRLYSLSLVGTL